MSSYATRYQFTLFFLKIVSNIPLGFLIQKQGRHLLENLLFPDHHNPSELILVVRKKIQSKRAPQSLSTVLSWWYYWLSVDYHPLLSRILGPNDRCGRCSQFNFVFAQTFIYYMGRAAFTTTVFEWMINLVLSIPFKHIYVLRVRPQRPPFRNTTKPHSWKS